MNAPFRSQWPVVRLGAIAEFIRGVTYKPADVSNASDPNAIACLRTKNIQADLEDEDLVFIPRSGIKEGKLVCGGDILVSSANSWNLVGKCCWIPDLPYQATFGGFTSILRVDPKQAFARYLYHWFSTDRTQRLARSFGQQTTNISNLNQGRCLELELPLPPLDEQRRIAAILDKADALRRKRKRAIDLLDSLTQSIFMERFVGLANECATVRLSEVCSKITDGVHQKPEYAESGTPFISVKDITTGKLIMKNCKFISNSDHAKYTRRCRPELGDILYTKVGATYGRPALVDTDQPFSIYVSVALIKPIRELIRPRFLNAALSMPVVKAQADRRIKGIGVPDLHLDQIQNFTIPLPPLSEQIAFEKILEKFENLLHTCNEAIARHEDLFSSLQSRAFSGQL